MVDIDQSNRIEIDEFKAMFEKMGIKEASSVEIQQIFSSIDFDFSNSIEFPEFIHDFETTVKSTYEELLQRERERRE